MPESKIHALDRAENCDFVHALMEQRLARGGLEVPLLPEVALRVMRLTTDAAASAAQLAALIEADATLTMSVLRIATSAAKRPTIPIGSLHQAVAWLGFDEAANVAFTLALQGKLLNIPGQNRAARWLWRHALASALWAKHLAQLLASDAGTSYLCGLLHGIGKPVALGAVHEIVQRAQVRLSREDYDRLIETFHRPIGVQVASAWGMPAQVLAAVAHWEAYASAGPARLECNIVNLAHRLADCTLNESTALARDLLVVDPVYADLGLGPEDAAGLFDAARFIHADMDGYFPP